MTPSSQQRAPVIPATATGTAGTLATVTTPPASTGDMALATVPEPAYQGLPAKFALPQGTARSVFTREMLETQTPRVARVWMVSRTVLGWLQGLLVLAAVSGLAAGAREIRAGWRSLWAGLQRSRLEPVPE